MKRIHVYITIAASFLCFASQAQDPHFSQYFASPFTINPALTGKGVSDWRAAGMFRSQWWGAYSEPYNTTTVSIEKGISTGEMQKSTLGIGFSFMSDASNGGLLKNNYAGLHLAYNLALDGEGREQLGIGITGTYANRLLNLNMFDYQSQFGSMGFQRSAPSNDMPVIDKVNYIDFNTGITYSKRGDAMGYHFGAALFHASRPVQGVFKNSNYSLETRYSLQAGTQLYSKNGNELHLSGLLDIQGKNKVVTLGAVYKIKTHDDTVESVNVGMWKRFGDAYYPYVALESRNWLVGASYDFVTSSLNDSYNSVQSMELSFVYLFGKKKTENTGVVRY
ncbi:type IX secretion system membrane protein PorP/SprF [Sediminibacterium roseum]|uniref:Type IX secretion system membrane protein PorP/SprF n=1 Tax=Sediminibacterium roseum TaxID=1978412 RepID=A0ABW9ZTK5_9BACT|nr:PorP/SprF family type IX secretion system membrane protein [Sediminibacterium roseum]NCI50334.1 type IX secretion system membrane protein PorP/SprF [Sediminibacterium roseum]